MGTQVFLDWRKRRQATKRAKRLISAELLTIILTLSTQANLRSKSWVGLPDVKAVLPTSAWEAHRADIVGAVSEGLLERLVAAYALVEADRARLTLVNEMPPGTEMTEDIIAGLKETVVDLKALRKDLGT